MSFLTFIHNEWPWFVLLGLMVVALAIIEWRENGHGLKVLSLQQGIRLLNDRRTVALDVRSSADFNQGHIHNTKNIDNDEVLLKNAATLIKKKDLPVLLICEHNHQASRIGKALKAQGYTDINLINGGLSAWRKENLPLENTHA
jgi:rhodanese-related sulfurtransferase